jgi:predicted nuclease with TOPRIM domain
MSGISLMQEQLQKRLQSLKAEYDAGQQVLANLEAKKAGLRETLMRISGAIQVLEEELAIHQNGNYQSIEVLAKEE